MNSTAEFTCVFWEKTKDSASPPTPMYATNDNRRVRCQL